MADSGEQTLPMFLHDMFGPERKPAPETKPVVQHPFPGWRPSYKGEEPPW